MPSPSREELTLSEPLTAAAHLQPASLRLDTSSNPSADGCRVYNYHVSVGNPSIRALPSQGAVNNGNTVASFNQDNADTSFSRTAACSYDSVNRLTQAQATGNSTSNQNFI